MKDIPRYVFWLVVILIIVWLGLSDNLNKFFHGKLNLDKVDIRIPGTK